MKEVIITPENLHKQKLSDVLESIKEDIRHVQAAGIRLSMYYYINVPINKSSQPIDCTACIGGAAVLGFIPEITTEVLRDTRDVIGGAWPRNRINGYEIKPMVATRLKRMARMFDCLRAGDTITLANIWNRDICNVSANHVDLSIEGREMEKVLVEYSLHGMPDEGKIRHFIGLVDKCVTILRKADK